MQAYQRKLSEIHEAGAELVAISPVNPDNSLNMAEKNALEFKVLSDTANAVARDYGLVYEIPERVRPLYDRGGMIDLTKYNDDDAIELPLSVTYIVDTDGIIKYAFLDADYRKRAETSELLAEVRKLTGN